MTRELVPVYLKVTIGESLVASLAATVCFLILDVPVWAMFIGWIAFFTRGVNLRQGLINLACVLVGIGFGMAAAFAMAALTPHFGAGTLSVVVFAVAMVVLSLRLAPVFNNLLGFFLGLVAYFASHLPPSVDTFVKLGIAAAVGSTAGWLATLVNKYFNKPTTSASAPS